MNMITVALFFFTVIYFTGCATSNHPNEVKVEATKANLFNRNDK